MLDSQYFDPSAKAPAALILADSEGGKAAAIAAVVASGGRVTGCIGLEGAYDRLGQQGGLDAVLLDVSQDHGFLLDRVLDRIDSIAAREDTPAIIAMPPAMIDAVAARATSDHITLLCQPDAADRVAALSCAWAGKYVGVNDMSGEMDSVRLRRLADEVTRIARALASLSSSSATPARPGDLTSALQAQLNDVQFGFAAEPSSLRNEIMPEAADIRAMLRLRRLRDNFFDPVLFADPAWDMLLDLMAARLEGDQVAVSSLCIAAAVPPTTALRWIKAMTDHHLFERHADPTDGRRIFIRLSDGATSGMARYFAAAKRIGGMAA